MTQFTRQVYFLQWSLSSGLFRGHWFVEKQHVVRFVYLPCVFLLLRLRRQMCACVCSGLKWYTQMNNQASRSCLFWTQLVIFVCLCVYCVYAYAQTYKYKKKKRLNLRIGKMEGYQGWVAKRCWWEERMYEGKEYNSVSIKATFKNKNKLWKRRWSAALTH